MIVAGKSEINQIVAGKTLKFCSPTVLVHAAGFDTTFTSIERGQVVWFSGSPRWHLKASKRMSSTCGFRSHRVACFLDRRASRQGSVRSEGTCARRALIACGLALPARRITVNLAPANLPKEGSHYDLPIALGLMAAIGAIPHDALTSFTVLGELGLDGSIAAVAGVLPAAISANGRGHGLICPYACGCEAAWASPEIEIVAAARIFLDFEQADDSATRKFSGTGLGLAISKRIIARMEGRIAVTSKETAGSTFTVSVPLPAAPDSP